MSSPAVRNAVWHDHITQQDLETMWRKWHFRPDRSPPPKPVGYKQSKPKLMVARNEFHTGTAHWERVSGHWRCVSASPHLKWMLKMETAEAKKELALRGFNYEWQTP